MNEKPTKNKKNHTIGNVRNKDGSIPTAYEIYHSSPTGELGQVFLGELK